MAFEHESLPVKVEGHGGQERDGVVVEAITYESSDRRTEAYLVRPSAEPESAVPGVVYAHGGGASKDTFLHEAVELASAGAYAILPQTTWGVVGRKKADLLIRYSRRIDLQVTLRHLEEALRDHSADHRPRVTPPMSHKIDLRFTEEMRLAVVSDYQTGMATTQLTRKHRIGKGTVLRILEEAGVQRRRQGVDTAGEDTAIRLYESGLSLAKVGELLGVTAETVRTVLRRRGVARRDPQGRSR